MNKERLEEIKFKFNNTIDVMLYVPYEDVKFLIEQAERVPELEEEMERYRSGRNVAVVTKMKMDELEQQNKRYREELEKIARINIDQGTVTVSEVHAVLTARKALEGESNE